MKQFEVILSDLNFQSPKTKNMTKLKARLLKLKNVKIGPSSNEVLKYRDIEIVKFEFGPCCYHFLRGTIYILKPV